LTLLIFTRRKELSDFFRGVGETERAIFSCECFDQ
jgi:hypothetical protein